MERDAIDDMQWGRPRASKRPIGRRLAGPGASAVALAAIVLMAPARAAGQPEGPPPPPPPAGPGQVSVTVGPQPPPPPPPGYYAGYPRYYAGPPPRLIRWGGDLRLSYGIPTGNAFQNQPLSNVAGGLFQIQGSGDLIILNRVALGAHIGGGIASPSDGIESACNAAGADCTVWDFTVGVHAEYRFLPPPSWVDPWVELGVSYEILGVSESDAAGDDFSGSFGGTDVDFTAGCDFQLGPLGLGPFLTYRFGRYTSRSVTENGVDVDSGLIGDTASHGWLLLGVRARY